MFAVTGLERNLNHHIRISVFFSCAVTELIFVFFSLAEKKLIHNAKKQKTSSLSYFPHLHLIHDTCAKQKNSS